MRYAQATPTAVSCQPSAIMLKINIVRVVCAVRVACAYAEWANGRI
ncbi:MAG: hypothetical protein F6K26_29235 [Moorea sp. SIO2I5]|nr:hypothetical protein [Moorena sp. SIO2I5]